MRRLVATLTALLLLANAMFGCCRHHVLTCAQASEVATKIVQHDPCCHHEPSQAEGTPQQPHKYKHECYGTCAYLPVEKTHSADELSSDVMTLPALMEPQTGLDQLVSMPRFTLDKSAHAPALRIHLLHQSLVI